MNFQPPNNREGARVEQREPSTEPARRSSLSRVIKRLWVLGNRTYRWIQHWTAVLWEKSVETFRFLPIRFKLSLIIGSIVIAVVCVLGFSILQSQKIALMSRMNQVCNYLAQNLAENVKADLLLRKNDKIKESVLRLRKQKIEGLMQIAVINHQGKVVGFSDAKDREASFSNPAEFLKLKSLTRRESTDRFEFIYPIITTLEDEEPPKQIVLGAAFLSFSKDDILAPINRARDIAIGVAFLVVLVALFAINIIANKMARQIQLLSNGAREVARGNLNVQIAVSSKDELGHLAHEFNTMIQHLREKMHMQKYVSKYTVDMIRDVVRSDYKNAKAILRSVAVLFSDVRNFSTIAEELQPEEIVKLINVYFDLQTQIIEKHDGIVDKFMGDQIMAVFEGPNLADNALRAAVEIQRQLRILNHERELKNQVTLGMGIGINNGQAVTGHMGSKSRMDYTVIGDVVNVAARLCGQAKTGQIITSLELARKVNGSYPTARLKSIKVKGRSQAVKVCEVDYNREILM